MDPAPDSTTRCNVARPGSDVPLLEQLRCRAGVLPLMPPASVCYRRRKGLQLEKLQKPTGEQREELLLVIEETGDEEPWTCCFAPAVRKWTPSHARRTVWCGPDDQRSEGQENGVGISARLLISSGLNHTSF